MEHCSRLSHSNFFFCYILVLLIAGVVEGASTSEEERPDRKCDVDKYYDEFTRNCEACSLLCEVARDTMEECEKKCAGYLAILSQQTTTPVYRPRHGHHGGQGHGTGEAVRVDHVQIATELRAIKVIFLAFVALHTVFVFVGTGTCLYFIHTRPRRKRVDEESVDYPIPYRPSPAVQAERPPQENVRDHPEGGDDSGSETSPLHPVENGSRCNSHRDLNVHDALGNQQAYDAGYRGSSAQSEV